MMFLLLLHEVSSFNSVREIKLKYLQCKVTLSYVMNVFAEPRKRLIEFLLSCETFSVAWVKLLCLKFLSRKTRVTRVDTSLFNSRFVTANCLVSV